MDKIIIRFTIDKLLHNKPKDYQDKVHSYVEQYLKYSNRIGIDLIDLQSVINFMVLLDIQIEDTTMKDTNSVA